MTTLALQITTARRIESDGVKPAAVVGYSFGEYAAAVIGGIMDEEDVVKVIAARDHAVKDVEGAMLNVFCDVGVVRSTLAQLVLEEDRPSLGIISGPQHVVLSGSKRSITNAETLFKKKGVKTRILMEATPFHSSLMKEPSKTMPEISISYTPHSASSSIPFISGISGGKLPHDRLGLRYWQRHMYECVDFLKAMTCAREMFPEAVIVDVGPSDTLTGIVRRYSWIDASVVGASDRIGMDGLKASAVPWKEKEVMEGSKVLPTTEPARPHVTKKAPVTPPPTTISPSQRSSLTLASTAASILKDLFGYSKVDQDHLLNQSAQAIGLQSLDYVLFAEEFKARTGFELPLSSYTVEESLLETIKGARRE